MGNERSTWSPVSTSVDGTRQASGPGSITPEPSPTSTARKLGLTASSTSSRRGRRRRTNGGPGRRPPRRPHASCRSAGRGRPGRAPPTTRRSHVLRDDERRSSASRGSVVVGSVIAHLPESGTGAGQVPDIGGVDPPDQGGGEAGQLGCQPFVHAGVGVDLSSDGDPGFVGRPGRRCTIDHREPPTGDTYVRPSARITTPRATSTTAKTTSPHRPRARATTGRAATAWPARQHGATSTRNTVA